MKKVLVAFIIGILVYSCAATKTGKSETRYFDENNLEISKSKFNQFLSTYRFLEIPGDSSNYKKLVNRLKRGQINNRERLEILLENTINRDLESDKPLVIIYYPGKDPCNSSGSSTRKSKKEWFQQLEDGIYEIAQTKPIYIYKDDDGLEKYDGILTWHKDPEGAVERVFFQYHYPCSSFVVISKEGNYMSYFGEFPKEYVWDATKLMHNPG